MCNDLPLSDARCFLCHLSTFVGLAGVSTCTQCVLAYPTRLFHTHVDRWHSIVVGMATFVHQQKCAYTKGFDSPSRTRIYVSVGARKHIMKMARGAHRYY